MFSNVSRDMLNQELRSLSPVSIIYIEHNSVYGRPLRADVSKQNGTAIPSLSAIFGMDDPKNVP